MATIKLREFRGQAPRQPGEPLKALPAVKVCELSGEWLDYAVACAEGHAVDPPLAPGQEWPSREQLGRKYEPNCIRYSSDWQFGGPIIERERIALARHPTLDVWVACARQFVGDALLNATGPTPLIAAMRAFVASKFGEEVPDA